MVIVACRRIGPSALVVFSALDLGRCPSLGWGRAVGAGPGGGEFGDEGGEEVRCGGAATATLGSTAALSP